MKLWIAEEPNAEIVLHSVNKDSLLKQVRRKSGYPPINGKLSRWEVWCIDPQMNREFLEQLVSAHFTFRDIEPVSGSWKQLYIKNGKIVEPPAPQKKALDPRPGDWTVV